MLRTLLEEGTAGGFLLKTYTAGAPLDQSFRDK